MATVNRGAVVLQPAYFTSSVYYKEDSTKPFELSKTLWTAQGWKWMHFKVFDSRTRETFLNVTVRLFLERMVKTEAPFVRTVVLFALYTFFNTQPTGSAPTLRGLSHIPIPIDQYTSLIALPGTLTTPYLAPLEPFASYVVSALVDAQVFHLLPNSELGVLNPRDIPREIFVGEGLIDSNQPQRKGHYSKRDKVIKARTALDAVGRWLDRTPSSGAKTTRSQYEAEKTRLMQEIGASQGVVDRLLEAHAGWPRVQAASGSADGMLRMLQ
ncbi:hypothetical protein C8F04DRAFT_1075777 [Mycena alexandri]|uniref:Uncharacterized protein n=1 Tax=Mycena alexandri TaxID=1745969 RepID=A0AAD6TBK4_9AGAR|nr:hypothetical protein C8F04DRAFT_1075777 [Mycena alexandri]